MPLLQSNEAARLSHAVQQLKVVRGLVSERLFERYQGLAAGPPSSSSGSGSSADSAAKPPPLSSLLMWDCVVTEQAAAGVMPFDQAGFQQALGLLADPDTHAATQPSQGGQFLLTPLQASLLAVT